MASSKSKVVELLPIKATIRYKKAYLPIHISIIGLKSVGYYSIELLGVQSRITSKLVKTAQFEVMKREEMAAILNEQAFTTQRPIQAILY